jgi:hypothetical protein
VVETAGAQRLGHRQVGVGEVDVLADEADLDLVLGPWTRLSRSSQKSSRRRGRQAEAADDVGVQALAVQDLGDVVDARGIDGRHDGLGVDVAHERDLALDGSGISRSARRTSPSGWMPTWRRAATECCVGLVFSSPLGAR